MPWVSDARLPRVVQRVRKQPEESSPLDSLYDFRLLLAIGTSTTRGVDLADRIQVADENVEPLVIDLFCLKLCGKLFSVETCDDGLSCVRWRVGALVQPYSGYSSVP